MGEKPIFIDTLDIYSMIYDGMMMEGWWDDDNIFIIPFDNPRIIHDELIFVCSC